MRSGTINKMTLGVVLILLIGSFSLASDQSTPCPDSSTTLPACLEEQKAIPNLSNTHPFNQSNPETKSAIPGPLTQPGFKPLEEKKEGG
jgi:hypothetical protein